MLVLLSPTKTQRITPQPYKTKPLFNKHAKEIHEQISQWSIDEIIDNYKISEKLATSVFEMNKYFNEKYPAVFCYQGSSLKSLAPLDWSLDTLNYAHNHLVILSALYGVLKPLDAVGMYRLDFLTKYPINLIEFWKDKVTQYLNTNDKTIINLASNEYSAMIDESNLKVPFINIDFMEHENGSYKTKATYSKIARGALARIIIEDRLFDPSQLKNISFDGYIFNKNLSTDTTYVFTR